jgi:uncharacterized membrane protein YwzB
VRDQEKQEIEDAKIEKLWEKKDILELLLIVIPVTVIITVLITNLIAKFLESP